MAITYKILGQSNPSPSTLTTLYTVPAATQAVISTITICNANATTNANYSIAFRPGGEAITPKHFIASNNVVGSLDTVLLTFGGTLGAADVVTVFATGSNIAFNLFGTEIS